MLLGRCCLCPTYYNYYGPSPSPPSLPSPIPYVGSCSSGVCTDSTFAKKWSFSWSPTWWTANAGQVACVNSNYVGSFTLNQRINSIHGLPNNSCAFDSDEIAWRWNNVLIPLCDTVPNMPRFTFLIQQTGLGASTPGTNFVLYMRWQERHGFSSTEIRSYYLYYTANKPAGTTQNCMGDITLTNPLHPNNPPVVISSGTNRVCVIQNPGNVVQSITMSPAA